MHHVGVRSNYVASAIAARAMLGQGSGLIVSISFYASRPSSSGGPSPPLAADPDVLRRTGRILVAAELAREYGFTDTDGTQPEPYDEL